MAPCGSRTRPHKEEQKADDLALELQLVPVLLRRGVENNQHPAINHHAVPGQGVKRMEAAAAPAAALQSASVSSDADEALATDLATLAAKGAAATHEGAQEERER